MNRNEIAKTIEQLESFKVAQDKIRKAGLQIPPRPDDTGESLYAEWENMKKRYGGVANIPYNELGEYLDKWSNMIAYAKWTEAIADIDQQTAREKRDTAQKQLYTLQDGNREIRAATVAIEPLYIKLEQEYTEKLTLYILIKGLREGYESRYASISRELTRRSGDILNVKRVDNIK